jgi:aminopeptidase-like protein
MNKQKNNPDLGFFELIEFVRETYLKNRTIVSRDIPVIFDAIESITGTKLVRHRYPTGGEYSTWIVPKQWDVVEAWLKDDKGNIIASYDDHPLFVSTYSKGVHQKLSKSELMNHMYYEESQPDAFAYNWRYAMDATLQLKDWGISLPLDVINQLDDGPFEIKIDIETQDGELLIGELEKKGRTNNAVVFLSNYCHPGQVNDSYTGLIVFLKIMANLYKRNETLFTYRLLIMPETIGSACYLTEKKEEIKNIKGAIFSEMVGWGDEWFIKKTRLGTTYFDFLADDCVRSFPGLQTEEFYKLIGNDEHMFNSAQVGVPSLSLQKFPFDEYHTSNDKPEKIEIENLQYAEKLVDHMINIIETDRIYRFVDATPFWMSRYKLYADDQYEPVEFLFRMKIVYEYLDGKRSVLQIAQEMDCQFNDVIRFVSMMHEQGLIEEVGHPLIL